MAVCSSLTSPSHKRPTMNLAIWVLLAQLLLLLAPIAAVSYQQFDQTADPDFVRLERMTEDEATGSVYVGAVNRIYKLSSDLALEFELVTGPVQDNPLCRPPPASCMETKISTNNINKALVVDTESQTLITCGQVYQGFCETRRLGNLSDAVAVSEVEVVTNNEEGTNVAFIAPGPGSRHFLYVGASHGNWIRTTVPTVSRRALDTFRPAAGLKIPAATFEAAQPGFTFDVNYMYGFSSGHFSYLIATQLETFNEASPLYTKLVRVCQQDESESDKFNSYIELPLVCQDANNVTYNLAKSAYVTKVGSDLYDAGLPQGEDMLFVTFSSDSSPAQEQKSIICMYPVRTLNEGFAARIQQCNDRGSDRTDVDWLAKTSTCFTIPAVTEGLRDQGPDYCHIADANAPLGGLQLPIEGQAIYSSLSSITAIAAMPHNMATVILLGDELGNLTKLRVQSPTEALLYEELPIASGTPVLQNGLMISPDKQYVFLMTESVITKVPIETCELLTTCGDCLRVGMDGTGDPHCGWCPLLNRCTRRTEMECPGATDEPSTNRWIDSRSSCIEIQSVTPSSIPSDATALLSLNVSSLPVLNNSLPHKYQCVFDYLGSTEVTSIEGALIQCSTPANLPTLQGGDLMVTLSLRATETNKLIVNTTFDFYNCSAFDSCTQCVADYLCNWCVFENRCMGNASSCNASGVIVGQQVQTDTERKGKDFCPRIEDTPEILIPAGEPEFQNFTVNVARLPVKSGYMCVLRHNGWATEKTTPGIRLSDSRILCSGMEYGYSMDENEVTADLQIRWGDAHGGYFLDNPSMLTVTLYKCGVKRSTCGQCLLADAKFSCGWCKPSQMCSITTACTDRQDWLSGQDLCPDPNITSFQPKSGHVAGGTRVVIEGYNLGQTASDIKRVTVANMSCQMIESEYKPAERVVCKTGASTAGAANGPVVVMIGRENSMEEDEATTKGEHFYFVVPSITGVHPLLGPMAGGSKVTLTGEHLNAGGTRSITVAGMPCNISDPTNLSSDVISCVTSASTDLIQGPIIMTFDLVGTAMSSSNFSYKGNPVITMQERDQTILSGGLDLPITGSNLNVVQEPKMMFRIERTRQDMRAKRQADQQLLTTITTKCTVNSATSMTCKSPDLKIPELANAFTFDDSTSPPSFMLPSNNIDFVMDAVTIPSSNNFQVFVDPEYFMFDKTETVVYNERKILEIKGRYIKATFMTGDVAVTVGNQSCSLMMQPDNADGISCEAPDNEVGRTYDVVVHHGNLVVKVGRLEYLSEGLPLHIIIGAACGAALILFILLFIICIWRRISANERRFKKMETQRDEMEMRVAQECKDAFAELQITVLTVSSDVEGSGIPFRDYRDYAARFLFPDNPCHTVFREIPVVRENISGVKRNILEKGLVQFGNLISNHTFLAIFVRTLEAQKTLALRDLSNIASLLAIALHNKMDFLTQTMKFLLQEHIKLYVKEGRPQLLLRRSEAVVEKLVSHWLSILMYDSLKDNMGKPLFHLFYAIKQQIDKGPVDAITGEARYGLSEMKVIRQQIDFKTLNIYTNSLDITSEPIQLKVLDCDTISQTKDKILDAIYKSCPFSKRPTREELDLEWSDRPDGPSSMILLDDDWRGRFDGEWKRINTLAHYQVPDGATLRLVRAQPNGGSLPNTPARKYGIGTMQSPATSASPIIDQEKGVNLWHLVKHVDSGSLRKGERDQKMMAEIYLPRLLTTKGILQQFVDELLETIFNGESDVPLAVKYLFDFLDEQATSHGITNPDVAHAWKSNCLQLRFWVNLIMNPTILFDINKTDTVDACVSIIGQTLIDSCSVSEQHLTKDSPSNKLLYAKDIPQYKQWVAKYYKDISDMASVSDQDMSAMLASHTNRYQNEFQPLNALNELYFCYACVFKSEILQSLDEDKEAQKQGLGDKLEDIFRLMADSA
ncbi:plexin-A2-like [Patiria miniata]|uniref:Sema domain-containing protein n=1 Tax=Patiria miniata TaxID=46514 RepID=A0A914AC17_PATMI|nr:plexin-A2-like [Patiria miniata]XP_038060884.1 plexin-A2-like [Patiria miniata]XP_038060885.1 plexin-A2-like [Patiria miniata]